MSWFGKRRQQDKKEKPYDTEQAIAVISADLIFLEALTSRLVAELPLNKRYRLLEQLQSVISGLIVLPPPEWAPPSREQDFRDELRRRMRLLIEQTTNQPKPINR